MRVDDRLATALQNIDASSEPARIGQWRQLIDILAQNPRDFAGELVAKGLVNAHALGQTLDVNERLAGVHALAGRIRSAPLVQLLAGDVPAIAAAAIFGADLSDTEWSELVPELPVRARGFLRSKPDLGQKTRLALSNWSGADFRIAGTIAPTVETAIPEIAPSGEIGAIVRRIEQWRKDREAGDSPRLPLGDDFVDSELALPSEISFETDDNGTIIWVDDVPRGAVVGVDIARAAYDDGPGPDAYGAAAFRQRMPLENARMRLRGSPLVDGDWRVNAAPFFDPLTGRFRGYRGIMRRPRLYEKPEAGAAGEEWRRQRGEGMQQVVHELRTPLGAIAGFAEIIEQQLFGPVTEEYRQMAGAILADAQRLLAGFEDLSVASRLDAGNFEVEPGVTDCRWLANRLAERLESVSEENRIVLNLAIADPVRAFAIDRAMAERIFSRFLSAVMMGCDEGESLNGRFKTEPGISTCNLFQLELPAKLKQCSDDQLFGTDPSFNEFETSADTSSPLLGLGFSLRLVRNLARKAGGDLRFQKESLVLAIPAVQDGDMDFRDIGGD
ncbi:MAG: HAMP domain-containing histidine kinase [Sphingorhabdus sp.]|nr:HAMP domain-containing histidine kinase [Sphingorhabdus sp.]